MEFDSLKAISPCDGRYNKQTQSLQEFFSEFGLIKYRVQVELAYLEELVSEKIGMMAFFPQDKLVHLHEINQHFSVSDAKWIKEKEQETNHDVKAVEYFVKEKLRELEPDKFEEFVHFGLTSQDINNTAIPLSLKDALHKVMLPAIDALVEKIEQLSIDWKDISMLAHTHGQPASPTRLGKEFQVFSERLKIQIDSLKKIPFAAKFGGATGNFNAHHVSFPHVDWVRFADEFLENRLGLVRSQTTTQIEHYDQLAALFDACKRINNIMLDLNRDMWSYISMDYFKQRLKPGEVGSSAMPHKVNPIDFENSEGNVGIANALFEHLASKLPVSRLQRDLSDSTVLRMIGVPFAHMLIALLSTQKGPSKLLLNKAAIDADLENNWAVVAEAIQTILRREGFEKPYELLKGLTRTNEVIDQNAVRHFIESLDVSTELRDELLAISPHNYTGIQLVKI